MPQNPKDRLESLFAAALNLKAADERAAFLEKECSHDLGLREKLEHLLVAHDQAGDFLGGEETELGPQVPIAETAGSVIGRYKLLERIGEGGFGVVYMARQTAPVKRKVALKIIKLGMDTKQVIGRFEAERQALAMMDHPNIAKVLDAGATESGRPYFVMEIVHGIPVTRFCDENKLTTKQRLELFVPICLAIQHAHQKGIIHRDVKPSNVLVTMHDDKPVPKVIDFGIAKATQAELTERTVFTRFQEFIGTPAYMSPEQAQMSGLDVDTRSDVYSLGVLLYELITGTPPFDAKQLLSAGYDEIRRVIREEDPPKPSTRVTEALSRANRSALRIPDSKIARELDWIVMKALEKDRTRRYESPSAFADDVRRHLDHDAVSAGAPGALYKFRKFARRNKRVLVATVAVMVALLCGALMSTWQAVRATNEANRARTAEREAKTQKAMADAVNRFFNEDVLAQSNPLNEPDPDIKLKTVLDRAAVGLKNQFENQPLVEARIRSTIGETYFHLNQIGSAKPQFQRALDLRTAKLGEEHRSTLRARFFEALTRHPYEAEEILLEVVETQKRVLGAEHPDTLLTLLSLSRYYGASNQAEAERLLRMVLAASRRSLDEDDLLTYMAEISLAQQLHHTGRLEEAERLLLASRQRAERFLDEGHYGALVILSLLGALYEDQGRLDDAEQILRKAMNIAIRTRAEDGLVASHLMNSLAQILMIKGEFEMAEPYLEKALAATRKRFGDRYPGSLNSAGNLTKCHLRLGNSAAGEALMMEFVAKNPHSWPLQQLLRASLTQPSLADTVLLQYRRDGENWRYTLADPQVGWHSPDYDDATWFSGSAIAGNPAPEETDIWLRCRFALDSPPDQPCGLWVEFDDEAQFYLNGKHVAAANDGDGYYRLIPLPENPSMVFREGSNLLAVHARRLGGDTPRDLDVGIHVITDPGLGNRRLEEVLTKLTQQEPADDRIWEARGEHFARQAKWEQALADYSRAKALNPERGFHWFHVGHLLLHTGKLEEYQAHCAEMLAQFADTKRPEIADLTSKAALLGPSPGENLEAAARAASQAAKLGRSHHLTANFQVAKGLAELRSGNAESAADWCRKALAVKPAEWAAQISAQLVLTLAYHESDKDNDARRALAIGKEMVETRLPKAGEADLSDVWDAWIFCQQLLKEAEQRIGTRK